jgi:ATP-dependent exoDNAse (exonuclease V) alpha subunit
MLRNEGFAQATTVEDFLRNAESRGGLQNGVVICDEAGLKSNRQGAELFRLAQKHDMRVLLVGDVRQHVSVEAGDFLRVLEAHSKLGRCQVEEIYRQIPDDYRAAITQMAAGNVRQGLEGLDRMNWDQGWTVTIPGEGSEGLSAADRSGTPSGSLPGRFVYLGRKS